MQTSTSKEAVIQLAPNAIHIHGKSEIILCASLFYFRLPRGLWKERLHKVRSFGYNAIDVYFPWNYHETEEGVWDFSGEKDVAQFLQDASEAGLWVVARPGPYICSEWDGGALPAYLFVKENLRLRDNDPQFLEHVARWYAQILPILRTYELGQGGTVIAVQLDNELDFYPCSDPAGYMTALRDLAVQQGIRVPLIACAGQGGLFEASGYAEEVVPTCNFYPNDRDPVFEEKVLCYREELAHRGYPLLVTETNRSHFLLRRLLSAGAKLLGPYLQVSGTNFGFTNAANNWGNPLAFLTSDYDFHGMITPEGHIREEAYEGRLLHHVIQTYGSSLAQAIPTKGVTAPYRLTLDQGGELLFLSNVTESGMNVYIHAEDERIPRYTSLVAVAGHCPILPVNVPLETWGIAGGGKLDYATAELLKVKRLANEQRTLLVFHTEGVGELRFSFDTMLAIKDTKMVIHELSDYQVTLSFQSSDKETRTWIQLSDGHTLEIIGMSRARALLLESINEAGELQVDTLPERLVENEAEVGNGWMLSVVDPLIPLISDTKAIGEHADYLEKHGIYRGFAWYKAQLPLLQSTATYQGFIVQQGSDVVSLYASEQFVGTVTPGGTSHYFPNVGGARADSELTARMEIWGHTNFHDTNLPGLHLNSLKGLTNIVGITSSRDLNQNWRFKLMQPGEDKANYVRTDLNVRSWPITSLGGWLSAEQPAHQCYRKQVTLSDQADAWMLHMPGNFTYAYAYVNEHSLGQVNPMDPFVDITPYVKSGETVVLTLFLDKTYSALSGSITLYEGKSATDWTLAGCQEKGMLQHAQISKLAAKDLELPICMNPGEVSWLYTELKDTNNGLGWRVFAKGRDLKLTVFFNGHLVGRLWTQGGTNRPIFRGGNDESFYLPGPWFHEQGSANELVILLEAVGSEESRIESLRFVPVSAC